MSFLSDELLKGTDWQALERAVARIMSHCGWRNVVPIGRTGDMGGDILAVRQTQEGLRTWVVQVKAATGGTYVGVNAVAEAIGALSTYGAQSAAVATNGEFTASAYRRKHELGKAGYDFRLWNGHFLQEVLAKWPAQHNEKKELRPYQAQIVDKIISAMVEGRKRIHFIMATGLGKTVVAGEVVRRLFDSGCKTALILCHSQDLAFQLERAFWPHLTSAERTSVFVEGSPPHRPEGITFGLYQTMQGYLSSLDPFQYDVVIIDESHHALASGFLACIQHMTPKLLLGMTATPWRGDGESIDRVFGPPIGRVSLVDGMAMGYLAEVDYRIFCDNINWAEIPNLSSKTFSIRDLNKRLFLPQRDDAAVQRIASVLHQITKARILVFSPSIRHAERFANLLCAAGIPAKCVSGLDRALRQKALMEFASDRLNALVGVDVFNEGIDLPEVNVLVFMRATHSRRIFVQQLGRGLRLTEGKRKVVILDFVADIRRFVEVAKMNQEARRMTPAPQALYLKNGFVTFEDLRVSSFIDEWLKDIADVADESENHKLIFPVIP